ncbi:restriction endonuclease [Kitasatospora indigofera]|uniref:restriction endonuclease n=1 Tax=Kitasatospora indigofera TaxID=67307 RepID=UPI0036300473
MARRKSVAQQLLDAYQAKQKAKAAQLKKEQAERDRLARKAEQDRQRLERQAAVRMTKEHARLLAAGERELVKQQTAQEREAARVERELAKRLAERERAVKAQAREQEKAERETVRLRQAADVELLRESAVRCTEEVRERVEELESILLSRPGDLGAYRRRAESRLAEGGPEAFAAAVEDLLVRSPLPEGCRPSVRAAYAPEAKQLLLDVGLPAQGIIPEAAEYRFVAQRKEVVVQSRKEADVKDLYRRLVARLALHAIEEGFAVTGAGLVDSVLFNGHVDTKDRATGRAIRPCLVSVVAERETFAELVLDEPELDPARCLHHLNAIVSRHPFDMEAVAPVAVFDLTKYQFIAEVDVVAGLDSRPDLVQMDPFAFEHLVRQLFEAIGLEAWTTQASRDDGVDAVAVNRDPLTGGLCIIQAKRLKGTVPTDAVRALAGVMHDKAAAKGILVTTAWFGKSSVDFAHRTGRLQLIDGRGLKALLREHLGIDALLGLPKVPPGWRPEDVR